MSHRGNLKKHIEAKHFPNVFSYQCTECLSVVGSKVALINHMRRIHPKNWLLTNDLSAICNLFDDSGHVTNPEDLDQFVLTSEDGSYFCGICNQAMSQKSNLKRHIESKHFANSFSYQCPECPHVVGTRKALERHKQNCHPKIYPSSAL